MKRVHRYKIGDRVDFRRASWGDETGECIRDGLILAIVEEELPLELTGLSVFQTVFQKLPEKMITGIVSGGKYLYYKIQLPNHEFSLSDRNSDPQPEYVRHDLIVPESVSKPSIEELLTHPFLWHRLLGMVLQQKEINNEQKKKTNRKVTSISFVK